MSRVAVFGLIVFGIYFISVKAKHGFGPGEQDWGFVNVREGAHMFYWLYQTTAEGNPTDRPLAIWLQGGPGGSSTGQGNFLELGPLDHNGDYRNFTWVRNMNVLFIDNPVGSGFSYVDRDELYTENNRDIALDLVSLMKGFYKNHTEYETVPLHIFSQSYGAKMAAEFALELYNAVQRGDLKSNLKSVGLGSPWISAIDSVLSWNKVLEQNGLLNTTTGLLVEAAANKTKELSEDQNWREAIKQWEATQDIVVNLTGFIPFFNINDRTKGNRVRKEFMEGDVREALSIPPEVQWVTDSDIVFEKLSEDFLKPVIHIVDELLARTDLQVFVYSGEFDLICSTVGTIQWIDKMQWRNKDEYNAIKRSEIIVNGNVEGYEKSAGKFTMFWVLKSGHSVPADNPRAMEYILRKITKYDE